MPGDKPDTRLLVRTEATNSFGDKYLILRVSLVHLKDDDARSFRAYDGTGHHGYEFLGIRAQMDHGTAVSHGYAADFYGTDLEFVDPYRLTLRDAEAGVKELRRIFRHMDRQAERLGRPATTTDLLVRIAAAVGANPRTLFLCRNDTRGLQVHGTTYRSMNADDLRYHLNTVVREWIDTNHLARKEAS